MTNYVVVLPYAHQPYFDECIKTLRLPSQEILAIDNTHPASNLGVAESWNRGIDTMRRHGREWLIIVSAAIRFGEAGGLDLLDQIEAHQYAQVIHFGTKDVEVQNYVRGESPGYAQGVLGWHLTAIRRDVVERVGYFDPNFYPVYFEDIDYDLRVRKAFSEPVWMILPVDAQGTTIGHGVQLGGVKAPAEPNIAYFATKWGRHPAATGLGEYDRPFNDPNNSLAFFPPAHGRTWNE